jgi:iron(II)-dependent oxidoreductase
VLRHGLGEPPIRAEGDALYDSSAVAHDTRWDLPLPSRAETLAYMREVRDRVLDRLQRAEPDARLLYLALYTVFHEDMHDEAFTYTRQTLGYPAPPGQADRSGAGAGAVEGDVPVPGGEFLLGGDPGEPFVFDNEKWAHPVEVRPFRIARGAVTQAEFAGFVDDRGYGRRELWSETGWAWRVGAGGEGPVYWRRTGGEWQRRDFDRWVALEPTGPSSTSTGTRPRRIAAGRAGVFPPRPSGRRRRRSSRTRPERASRARSGAFRGETSRRHQVGRTRMDEH